MSPFVELTDGVITLRPFEPGEAKALHHAVRESLKELKPWMSWADEGYTAATAEKFITLIRNQWPGGAYYGFAILDAGTGDLLGGCSLSHIHPVYHFCNLGYWVRTTQRGRGIAGRAAQLAARFAFEKLGLIRVEIVIAMGNNASKRVAEKVGAHYEGVLLNRMLVREEVYDAWMYSLLPSDFTERQVTFKT
jgi:RimJ/RimL family protein N-acetyltransferase